MDLLILHTRETTLRDTGYYMNDKPLFFICYRL